MKFLKKLKKMHKSNKLYLAKYLPVEGEIKEGMKYILTKSLGLGAYKEGYIGTAAIDFTKEAQEDQGGKILKLFLCSRDIQVGDKVFEILADKSIGEEFEWTEEIHKHNHQFIEDGDVFKVIGEISPEATWVKEGDEFAEDEVDIYDVSHLPMSVCHIKCPTCKYFH